MLAVAGKLSAEDLRRIEEVCDLSGAASGLRYPEAMMSLVNRDVWSAPALPPLYQLYT